MVGLNRVSYLGYFQGVGNFKIDLRESFRIFLRVNVVFRVSDTNYFQTDEYLATFMIFMIFRVECIKNSILSAIVLFKMVFLTYPYSA